MRPVLAIALAALVCAATAPEHAIRFAGASAGSGLDFNLNNSPTERKYLPETMAGGVIAFDYNNDGRIDLFFPNGAAMPSLVKGGKQFSNRLYRNDGNGRFTDVTDETGLAGSGYSIAGAAGDFDNDGYADLFVAGVHESHLYRNVGGKRFEDVTADAGIRASQFAVGASWLDFDRDGRLDLFILNYVQWSPEANPLCHDPSGRYVVYCHPKFFKGTANQLYRNLGDGKFEDVSESSGIAKSIGKGMGVAVADFNADGYPDIFVTNDVELDFLFQNLGDGRFKETALESGVALPDDGNAVSGMGADFRDYDNDGKPDIVFTALAGQTFLLFRNLGNGEFRDVTHRTGLSRLTSKLSGWGIAMADLDNDGWKDIFTANSHVSDNIQLFSGDQYEQSNSIFRNRGDGAFEGDSFGNPAAHRGAVIADFDNDGLLDAAVAVLGGRPELWRNVTPGANHWIEFKLVGMKSNRDGIGAVIRVGDARKNSQWNAMTSSIGYASSCLCPVHFGLGDKTEITEVEITWPSGIRQVLRHVKADQKLVVTEDSR